MFWLLHNQFFWPSKGPINKTLKLCFKAVTSLSRCFKFLQALLNFTPLLIVYLWKWFLPLIYASKCLVPIMCWQMAVPEGHLCLHSVCCGHWLSMFSRRQEGGYVSLFWQLSNPKSHFPTIAKLKRDHCQMFESPSGTRGLQGHCLYLQCSGCMHQTYPVYEYFFYLRTVIQSSCYILDMKSISPNAHMHYSLVSCLGYWEGVETLPGPMKSLQVTEVIGGNCGIFLSSTFFLPVPLYREKLSWNKCFTCVPEQWSQWPQTETWKLWA